RFIYLFFCFTLLCSNLEAKENSNKDSIYRPVNNSSIIRKKNALSSANEKFDVTLGCIWKGKRIKAMGDGAHNDTQAIQNCLYAAGKKFAKYCPARPWSPESGYPQCPQVEVFFPKGKYFVEGVWETSYPEHSSEKNSAYGDQWVVFSLPRGVSIKGEDMEMTQISLTPNNDCTLDKDQQGNPNSGTNTCSGNRFNKRRGTYLFMAGFEKLSGFCSQKTAKRYDSLCQLRQKEKLSGGSQNSFEEISLIGDLDALANDWRCNNQGCLMKSQSTAIHTYRGRELKIKRVLSNYWYRGLHSREGNGVSVTESHFLNNHKGSIYFSLPNNTTSEESYNIGASDPRSKLLTFVGTNNVINTPLFFNALESKQINPWAALSGIYVTGNIASNSCSDVAIVNNNLRYARIYYETPCGNVQIERNKVSRAAMPIQVGSYENIYGLNIAKEINILENEISESLSGILVRGCDFNTHPSFDTRCKNPSARPLIYGNNLHNFLSLTGNNSDISVSKMAKSKKTLAGIIASDASYVTIENNSIKDLQSGSQAYGLGIQSSRWNTSTENCYKPVLKSREVKVLNNNIAFKEISENRLENVGTYIENSSNLSFITGNTAHVQSNRIINASLSTEDNSSLFCSSTGLENSPGCPRRLDSSRALMTTYCLNNLDSCAFSLPGLSKAELKTLYERICTMQNKITSDEDLN
ncbi:MAG: hypothetical protein KBC84_08230, partial [Proteobacteria bacterium]|nr:hypothetical protein [Pseudomonadota bacterium]